MSKVRWHYKLPWLNWATAATVVDTAIWAAVYFIKLNWNWLIELFFAALLPTQALALVGMLGAVFLFVLWVNWVAWDRWAHRNVSARYCLGGAIRCGAGVHSIAPHWEWDEYDRSDEE